MNPTVAARISNNIFHHQQAIGDSIPVQQDPEVTLFENFVSEEEVG